MTNGLLNRTVVEIKTNKSGGAHAQGDVCVEDIANANSVINDTSGAYIDGVIWVCMEPAGVANNAQGLYACAGFVPVINLDTSAALGDFVGTSTTTKKGTPHAAPAISGDFAQVLGTGTSPAATLFTPNRGGGGGVGWTQVVDENGSSFANFTSASGTWASSGSVIQQTDTGAAERRAKYNNLIITGFVVYEAEINIHTSGVDRIGGLIVGFDGSNNGGMLVRLNEGSNLVEVLSDGVASLTTISETINIDTWYKLRLVVTGPNASIYLDDVLIASTGNGATRSGNASYLGLYSYQAAVDFRNIKAWNIDLP